MNTLPIVNEGGSAVKNEGRGEGCRATAVSHEEAGEERFFAVTDRTGALDKGEGVG